MEELFTLPELEIPATGLAGIYFLFWKGKLQYIGKSNNVYFRVAKHYYNMLQRRRGLIRRLESDAQRPEMYLDFDCARVRFCEISAVAFEEYKAIQRYRPPYNVLMNKELPKEVKGIQSTTWFQELTAEVDRMDPSSVKRRKFNWNSKPIARTHKRKPSEYAIG